MRYKFSQKRVLIAIAALISLLIARHANWQRPYHYIGPVSETAAGANNPSEERIAFVKRIVDGDTIVLTGGDRVRYIGINTPETHHPKKPVEYYGPEAAAFNKKLVSSKKVRLEFDKERVDKYGRTLAYVYLEDGTFVNAELVRQGYARTMTIPPNTKYADLFSRLQSEAKAKKIGLWARRQP